MFENSNNNKNSSNQNPLKNANILSQFCFWWLKDIVLFAKKNDLKNSDVYDTIAEDLSEPLTNTLQIAWNKEVRYAQSRSVKPSLLKIIVKTYSWTFLKLTLFQVFFMVTMLIQPQLLRTIMTYFDSESVMLPSEAYMYVTVSILLMILENATLRHGFLQLNRLGMRVKVACSSLIYTKITKLSSSQKLGTENTSVITLLSSDVAKFEQLFSYLAFMVILPLQLIIIIVLVERYIGLTATLVGIVLMILQTVPLQALYYKLASNWRAKQATHTDKRISLIDEVVSGIRVIKMYAWENYFEKLVYQIRRYETDVYLKVAYLASVAKCFMEAAHHVSSLIAFFVHTVQYRTVVRTADMLSIRQHFANFNDTNSNYLFLSVQSITNLCVSIKRIENFLSINEVKSNVKQIEDNRYTGTTLIQNVTISWQREIKSEMTLRDITIDFSSKKVHAVLGATGCGKSSLLKLILGELEPISGQVSIGGEISYASQEPWLFAASIRENILFGETYQEERYEKVVKACALLDDFNNLPYGDKTPVGDRGMSLSGGQRTRINLARAVYRDADIYLLDDPFSAVDTRVGKTLRSQCIDGLLKDKTVILVTHNLHYLGKDDRVVLLDSGKIQYEGSMINFQKHKVYTKFLPSTDNSYLGQEKNVKSQKIHDTSDIFNNSSQNEYLEPDENKESLVTGAMSKTVLLKYAKAGGYGSLFVALLAHIAPAALVYEFNFQMISWTETSKTFSGDQLFESNRTMVENNDIFHLSSIDKSMIIFGSMLVLIISTLIMQHVLFYRFIYMANRKIHDSMFAHLIRTSMRFFDINPTGQILNRFSDDTYRLDQGLSESSVEMLNIIFDVIASLVFIIIIGWWNILPIAIAIFFFINMSCLYVTIISKMKRLVGTAKSPVLSFVTSSLAGLTTIRSSKAESFVIKEFDCRQDKYTGAFFLVLATSSGFAFWIDLLVSGLFACISYSCIALKGRGVHTEQAGLILTTIYESTVYVSFAVSMFADTCAFMTNIERMLQYTELEPEDLASEKLIYYLPSWWPNEGEIRFERVTLKYSDENRPVLNDLSFIIEPGTKVGIVGRTGAGKSSLIAALFRLAKVKGCMLIDNVDTQQIDLSHLRSKISIIPQDPVLFSTSLRSNLDPLNEFDDPTLWSTLDNVGLKQIFYSLDQHLENDGKNLSLGQRQLLCLARAAVKNNKILVLDEATANVDSMTDVLIQKTIRDKFRSCTVLTIAHRLNTIMDSDKVLVMDHGRVVEYDHPHVLLQNPDGNFSKMLEQSGELISQNLRNIAERAYNDIKVQSTYC